jgi:hypothetical protein
MQIPDFKGIHLFNRLLWAKDNLASVQSQYMVAFEDDMDKPVKIMAPAPEWMACAMAGGILPPIEAYLMDKKTADGEPKLHPYADPIGPMTEEEAIEYLIKKDIPEDVWATTKSNSIKFVICKREQIPTNREFRNSWTLDQFKEIDNAA